MNRGKIWLVLALALTLCLSLCVVAHAEDGGTITVSVGTPYSGTLDGWTAFRYVLSSNSTVVNVSVTASVPLEVHDDVSYSGVTYGGKAFPHEYSFTNVLSAGEHEFYIWPRSGQPFECTVSVSVPPFSVDEREPNDDWNSGWDDDDQAIINPNVLALSENPLKGVIYSADGSIDYDWYMFTLDSARSIDISVKQYDRMFSWEVVDSNGNYVDSEWVDGYVPLAQPFTSTKRLNLSAGTYLFGLYSSDSSHTGRYEVSAMGAAITPSVVVPKSLTVTAGFNLGWRSLYTTPPLSEPIQYEYTLSSDKPAVLAVDPEYPTYASAMKPGKATLTMKLLDKTYKIKVTVAKNEFKRAKPLKPGKAQVGIFTSLKKASYDANGNLLVDIFVYNKSGKVLNGIERPLLYIGWDVYSKFYCVDLPAINFKKPIKNGAYGVYSLKITPEQFPMDTLNLRGGWIDVGISDNASAKRITFVSARTKGVVQVNAPMN